jgi:glycosyltransferase involved in cell wall biosynthesis
MNMPSEPECLKPARPGTVSVVLCTYNGAKYISAQLASYANQDRLPDELVVGDDGSTDETESLIASFARTAPFPVYYHSNTERLGVARNFDQSIQRCSGEFIALSDQDDEWRPDKLSVLVNLLQQQPDAGYACSDAELISVDSVSLGHRLWEQFRTPPGSFLHGDCDVTARHYLLHTDRILGATMLIRSAHRHLVTPIPASWMHDHWLSVTYELIGAYGVASPELLTRYRIHGQQTSGLRRGIVGHRKKRQSWANRRESRERRRLRLIELREHLVGRLAPRSPDLAKWYSLLDEADRIAEYAVFKDNLSWWQRKLLRVREWIAKPFLVRT